MMYTEKTIVDDGKIVTVKNKLKWMIWNNIKEYWLEMGKDRYFEQCLVFTRKTGINHWNITFQLLTTPKISCTPWDND